jgi:hypothetical protein
MSRDELRAKAPKLACALAWGQEEALAELNALIREARAAECSAIGQERFTIRVWMRERAACIRKGEL